MRIDEISLRDFPPIRAFDVQTSSSVVIIAGANGSGKTRLKELREYLGTRTRLHAYTGTVVQIDSDRAVQPVRFESFSLATEDPDDQDINYSWYLSPFIGRWQELVNKIYKKVAARDQKLAKFIKAEPMRMGSEALAANPDPFLAYQEVLASCHRERR